jgi:hypothetical protein
VFSPKYEYVYLLKTGSVQDIKVEEELEKIKIIFQKYIVSWSDSENSESEIPEESWVHEFDKQLSLEEGMINKLTADMSMSKIESSESCFPKDIRAIFKKLVCKKFKKLSCSNFHQLHSIVSLNKDRSLSLFEILNTMNSNCLNQGKLSKTYLYYLMKQNEYSYRKPERVNPNSISMS